MTIRPDQSATFPSSSPRFGSACDPAVLVMRRPATRWEEGLPVGDGRHGMMVMFNRTRDQLWLAGSDHWLRVLPPDHARPDLAHMLPEVRRFIAAGDPAAAEAAWQAAAKEAGYPYVYSEISHPGAVVTIENGVAGAMTGWRRWLDCRQGVAGAGWDDPAGHWERGACASRTDQIMAWWCSAPQSQSCNLRIGLGVPAGKFIDLWKHSRHELNDLRQVRVIASHGGIAVIGHTTHGPGWAWLLRAHHDGGSATINADHIVISQANGVTLTMAGAVDEDPEAALDRLAARLDAAGSDGAAIAARHAAAQQPLTERCILRLAGEEAGTVEDALATAHDGAVPLRLIEQAWWLGRHLLIASTHADGEWPPHLQGVWNATWQPPWFGNYTNDENVQMCHWHACPGGLPELVAPLRRWLRRSRADWAANARGLFGCSGVLAPLMQGGSSGRADAAEWHLWTAGAGWLARHLWELWEHSGDLNLLRDDILPLLDGVARFYADFLVLGADGQRHAVPSISVENAPQGWGARSAIDATMDIAVCREVLERLIATHTLLGHDPAVIRQWQQLLSELPAYRVNSDGALAEWIDPRLGDEYRHRHQSHLYPLFPGEEIGPAHPLFAAVQIAAQRRRVVGQAAQTSWSLVHLAHVNARLGDGRAASACIDALLRGCAQDNLLLCHNDWRGQGQTSGGVNAQASWQIDASLGLPSLCTSLLVRDAGGDLEIFPAVPPTWTTGELIGLHLRGGGTLNLRWNGDHGHVRITQGFRSRQPTAGPGWSLHPNGSDAWRLARSST